MQVFGAMLEEAIKTLGIEAKLLYQTKDVSRGKPQFEVWEIDDENIKKLNDSDDELWHDFEGWYRITKRDTGSITELYSVNERSMYGYPMKAVFTLPPVKEMTFDNFFTYLVLAENIYEETDIAGTATALAEANDLTLADFMHKYYG